MRSGVLRSSRPILDNSSHPLDMTQKMQRPTP